MIRLDHNQENGTLVWCVELADCTCNQKKLAHYKGVVFVGVIVRVHPTEGVTILWNDQIEHRYFSNMIANEMYESPEEMEAELKVKNIHL